MLIQLGNTQKMVRLLLLNTRKMVYSALPLWDLSRQKSHQHRCQQLQTPVAKKHQHQEEHERVL